MMTLREAVRKRPGMYFGDIDEDGADTVVYELLANAIDQFLANHVTTIHIQIKGNTISVSDDGVGFNLNMSADVERFIGYHHDAPTADNHAPHIHVQNGGLGLAILNAASSQFSLESCNGQAQWYLEFEDGEKVSSKQSMAHGRATGSTISVVLDEEIFGKNKPDIIKIRAIVFESVHLYPGLTIQLNDESFCSNNGLLDLGYFFSKPNCRAIKNNVFTYTDVKDDISFQAVAMGTSNNKTKFHSWVNGLRTANSGSHVDGFKQALADNHWNPEVALIHIIMHNPKYAGPCKDELRNEEVEALIGRELSKSIKESV